MCMCVSVSMCVCVCVCEGENVYDRERGKREIGKGREGGREERRERERLWNGASGDIACNEIH